VPASERAIGRVTGVAAAAYGASILLVAALNWPTRMSGGRDVSSIVVIGGPLLVLGIASALGVRFAIYALALSCSVAGLWLSVGSLWQVPFPWLLLNLGLAALLLAPFAALARLHWRRS
jgi:hypothetical protein